MAVRIGSTVASRILRKRILKNFSCGGPFLRSSSPFSKNLIKRASLCPDPLFVEMGVLDGLFGFALFAGRRFPEVAVAGVQSAICGLHDARVVILSAAGIRFIFLQMALP